MPKTKTDELVEHEALDRLAMLAHMVDSYACEHPAILHDDELRPLANAARDKLFDAYRKLGARK